LRAGLRPNHLTLLGLLLTIASAACLGIGLTRPGADAMPFTEARAGNGWLPAALLLLLLASAMDNLDGAAARLGRCGSEGGAFLDSTLDRFGDLALHLAVLAAFAWQGNFTLSLLAMLAAAHAFLVSYVRARAEVLIAHCRVGYFERPERLAAFMLAMAFGQVPAMLWLLATLPMLTAIRRIVYTLGVLEHRRRTGVDLSESGIKPTGRGLLRLAPWRHPRATLPWYLASAVLVAWVVLAPIDATCDPLRAWLGR